MRILHCSDLHIGVENYGRIDPATGLSTRLGDFLASLDEVVEYALTQSVDLVLLAGDVYKGRDPSQTHQREFAKRLNRLASAGIPTFLLVGNHDLPNAVSRATAVDIFPTLEVPHVYIGDSLQTYNIPTPAGPLQILAVPWPRRGRILSREDSRGLSIEEIRQEIEARMTAAIEERAHHLNPEVPAILTGHVTINGATVGTERSMMLGQDHVLLASAVQRPQLDYVALGHIHKHQVLRQESPMVVYSGSLQRVDFSEEGDNKGFCVIDLDPSAPPGTAACQLSISAGEGPALRDHRCEARARRYRSHRHGGTRHCQKRCDRRRGPGEAYPARRVGAPPPGARSSSSLGRRSLHRRYQS